MAGLLSGGSQPAEMMEEEVVETEAPSEEVMEEQTSVEENPEVEALLAKAVESVYSEARLPKLKKMFEDGGVEGFPNAMGIAVVSGLSALDVEATPPEVLAEVGVKFFEMLAEDIIESGVVQGVTPPVIVASVKEAVKMFAAKYPDQFNIEEFTQAWQQQVDVEGVEGGDASSGPMSQEPMAPAQPQGLLSGGM